MSVHRPASRACIALTIALAGVALFSGSAIALEGDRGAMLRSAVRIRYERTENGALITGHGTAFGVDLSAWGLRGRRYLLSAAHNVLDDSSKPYGTLKIEITEGTRTYWSQCKVLRVDADLDLCLVESGDDLPAITDLSVAEAALNEDVVMAGSPRGVPVALYDGVMRHLYYQGSVRSVVDIQFDHGCSGGPLYSAKTGKAVGVAVAGIPKDGDLDHTKGLFVPVHAIESFLAPLSHAPVRREPILAERVVPAAVAVQVQKPIEETPRSVPVQAAAVPPAPSSVAVAPVPPVKTVAVAKLPEPTASKPQVEVPPQPALTAKATVAANSRSLQPAGEFLDPKPAPKAAGEIPAVYMIEDGDSLLKISKRYSVPVQTLISMNNIKDPNRILVGSKLRLK